MVTFQVVLQLLWKSIFQDMSQHLYGLDALPVTEPTVSKH